MTTTIANFFRRADEFSAAFVPWHVTTWEKRPDNGLHLR